MNIYLTNECMINEIGLEIFQSREDIDFFPPQEILSCAYSSYQIFSASEADTSFSPQSSSCRSSDRVFCAYGNRRESAIFWLAHEAESYFKAGLLHVFLRQLTQPLIMSPNLEDEAPYSTQFFHIQSTVIAGAVD